MLVLCDAQMYDEWGNYIPAPVNKKKDETDDQVSPDQLTRLSLEQALDSEFVFQQTRGEE